jgi:predicted RNA binding protein YcfA (HicA-like mRNA interferase family)
MKLSGDRLVKALITNWQYRQLNRVGSHIILQTDEPRHHRISIPDHPSLRVGTLNAIRRDVARSKEVSREEILASV